MIISHVDLISLFPLIYRLGPTGISADLVVHVGGTIYADRGTVKGSPCHDPADRGLLYDRRLGHGLHSRSHSR